MTKKFVNSHGFSPKSNEFQDKLKGYKISF